MPSYSVAKTRDNLSSLIDKVLAGETVVITRHGKPTVELRVIQEPPKSNKTRAEWMGWLKQRSEARGSMGITALELKRLEAEDYER